MRGIMNRGRMQRGLSAQQLDILAGVHDLVHNTNTVPWKRASRDYRNDAGEPVVVRTRCLTPHGMDYRMGHFQLSNKIHAQLVELGGHYLFIAYHIDPHGVPIVEHHAMHPASKFAGSESKNFRVHPRDVFTGVV